MSLFHRRRGILKSSITINQNPNINNLHPLKSPTHEEVAGWSILPSYQLYESTFSKNVDPASDDEGHSEPPIYEAESQANQNQSQTQTPGRAFPNIWENTILANTHKLQRLQQIDRPLEEKIKVEVTLTQASGEPGRTPQYYDPLNVEFGQGDCIHGYVLVKNCHTEPLAFDMVSVVFEGRVSINLLQSDNTQRPVVFFKFLNMFDYKASWTPAYFIDTSLTGLVDPIDQTHLEFPLNRCFEPGITYKRFFSFTIPDRLLDCACETHQIPCHCMLPPSLGFDKSLFLQRMKRVREGKTEKGPSKNDRISKGLSGSPSQLNASSSTNSVDSLGVTPTPASRSVKDYSFPHSSINYSVTTRIVAKKSGYVKKQPSAEYIMVKEVCFPIRVIPVTQEGFEQDISKQKRFESFKNDVERSISRGELLDAGHSVEPRRRLSTRKQEYTGKTVNGTKSRDYEVILPYRRKSLTQAPKVVGTVKAKVSKAEHIVQYCNPCSYSNFSDYLGTRGTIVKIPVTFSFTSSGEGQWKYDLEKLEKSVSPGKLEKSVSPVNSENLSLQGKPKKPKTPEIKQISARIFACTVKSNKYPIPIELSQEMKFRNTRDGNDDLETYVIQPFEKYLEDVHFMMGKHGSTALEIDEQNLLNIKSLAKLELKTDKLKITKVNTKLDTPWKSVNGSFEKSIEVNFDISELFRQGAKPSHDQLMNGVVCLVPSFESCILVRYYYVELAIKFGNGDVLPIKVPLRIVK